MKHLCHTEFSPCSCFSACYPSSFLESLLDTTSSSHWPQNSQKQKENTQSSVFRCTSRSRLSSPSWALGHLVFHWVQRLIGRSQNICSFVPSDGRKQWAGWSDTLPPLSSPPSPPLWSVSEVASCERPSVRVTPAGLRSVLGTQDAETRCSDTNFLSTVSANQVQITTQQPHQRLCDSEVDHVEIWNADSPRDAQFTQNSACENCCLMFSVALSLKDVLSSQRE